MNKDKLNRLRQMLEQVDTQFGASAGRESLESLSTSSGTEGLDIISSSHDAEIANETLDHLAHHRDDQIGGDGEFALEAIVMPYHRPVVDIIENKMTISQLTPKWKHLGDEALRSRIEPLFKSVGRVDVRGHPRLPYAGTGFLVARGPGDSGVIMTNRHVAEIFVSGLGVEELRLIPDYPSGVDFLREYRREESEWLSVEKILMVHPYWDMALLRVAGLSDDREALELSTLNAEDLKDREIFTVGYPAETYTDDADFQSMQNRIFRGVYNVKRMQPGVLRTAEDVKSYNKIVSAVTHDATTAGGNSGSAVFLAPKSADEPLQIVGLHFAGAYLKANYAVPTHALASDPRVYDTGLNFKGAPPRTDVEYDLFWRDADRGRGVEASSQGANVSVSPIAPSGHVQKTVSLDLPIDVSVSVRTPTVRSGVEVGDGRAAETNTSVEGLFGGGRKISLEEAAQWFSPASLEATNFDWKAALSAAVASKVVYAEPDKAIEIVRGLWGMEYCRFIDVEDTQCFVAASPERVLVAFRGSESVGDWLSNMEVLSVEKEAYGRVHGGFYRAFAVVQTLLEHELSLLAPQSVMLCGHSLGGALATIAAAEWSDKFPLSAVYTFGQPAVGKTRFRDYMRQHVADWFYRFVNDDDIVTKVPPTYRHVGRRLRFNAGGDLDSDPTVAMESVAAEESGEAPMLSTEAFVKIQSELRRGRAPNEGAPNNEAVATPQLEGFFPSVSDHDLVEYILKIKDKT